MQLAELMKATSKLTSIDVRGNESLGEGGVGALVTFMNAQRVKNSTSVPRSVCGVTGKNSMLDVPREPSEWEVIDNVDETLTLRFGVVLR